MTEYGQNQRVYCRGTANGKGVIEALIERGGKNALDYNGKKIYDVKNNVPIETYYYISSNNLIKCCTRMDNWSDLVDMLLTFHTEIPPLIPQRWRAEKGENFWIITPSFKTCKYTDFGDSWENRLYNAKNYFPNEELASKVAIELQQAFEDILEKIENNT